MILSLNGKLVLDYIIGYGLIAIAVLVVGTVVLGLVWGIVDSFLVPRKLEAARREYEALYITHGYAAKEMCPHRIVDFTQTGIPDVFVATNKWCKICGKDLGPATLHKSIFGNSWR